MTINLGAQSTSSILFCKSTSSDKGERRQREIKRETKRKKREKREKHGEKDTDQIVISKKSNDPGILTTTVIFRGKY